jgi:hypothetical protein
MRGMGSSFKAAVLSGKVHPVILTKADFDSGSINLASGYGTLPINGTNYLGTGKLLQVDPAEETGEINATNATFQLSGIQEADISIALNENYNGRPGRMKLALFDDSNVIIDDPLQFFSGRMDVMTDNGDPVNPIITLTAENDLIRLNRTRQRNYTHADQQIDYPGDNGLGFVAAMQNKQVLW